MKSKEQEVKSKEQEARELISKIEQEKIQEQGKKLDACIAEIIADGYDMIIVFNGVGNQCESKIQIVKRKQ